MLAGAALILGGTLALWDYMRVVVIFSPPANAGSLEQRIAAGRRSIFFAHHADYAAATVTDHPGKVMSAFARAPHYLLDARLMQAWAIALNENGETDKASYVAQRLKEFHNEQSDEFFEPCKADAGASAPSPSSASSAPLSAGVTLGTPAATAKAAALPFQCRQPSRPLTFEDFR